MYAKLLLLRSTKVGCFPRRLASSSSRLRIPEQAVRAIFLFFTFRPTKFEDGIVRFNGRDDWTFCSLDSIFNACSIIAFLIEHVAVR